jgi:glycosyltransferase involved in cell wall biosynthesis
MNLPKKKVLFQLPVQLKPVYYGMQSRILGFLKYFSDRKDHLSVDIVTANQRMKESYITPMWNAEQTEEALQFVDNVFVYEGKNNWLDFAYTRTKIAYYQLLLNQQLPVDTDYYAPPGYVNFVQSLADRTCYDYALFNTINFASLAAPFQSSPTQTIVDMHDLQSKLGQMLKDVIDFKGLHFDYEANFAKEIRVLSQFSKVISNSNDELSALRQHLSLNQLDAIPHLVEGIDSQVKPVTYAERSFQYDLLFVGMANTQNSDAMTFFIDSIFPHIVQAKPDVQFAIAGKVCKDVQVKPEFSQNIKLLGHVPDLAQLYLQSRVMVCPVRTGAGTNVKLVEAISYFLPIVTTSRCASGLSLDHQSNALITDDPLQYAAFVLQVLTHPQLAQALSTAAAATYQQQYSKSAIYAKLDAMFGMTGCIAKK